MEIFKFLTTAQTRALARSPHTWCTIENYYKVKWGHSEEFIERWRTEHYPFLKKLVAAGDILSIHAEAPVAENAHATWWDFKVTLIFKDERLAVDYTIANPFTKQLYADITSYQTADKHSFGLLLAHLHIPVESLQLN